MATLGLTEAEREAVERLQRDVIDPSMTNLVILDFWAEWCGPCKQLSPVLDKVAADYAGKGVKLVKIDVDADKLIAAQFQIRSIPTVYAFFHGQPVADLTNYRTEAQLKAVLDQLIGQLKVSGEEQELEAELEPLLATAEQILADGDAPRAAAFFGQIVEMAPGHPEANAGLARALLAESKVDEARTILDGLPESAVKDPAVARARAALDLASAAPAPAETDGLESRIAADPDDHDARLELASAKLAAGDRDGAADALFASIERDKKWNDGAARKKLLQMLEAQGLEDPWARAQRRRLSALLFT